MSQFNSCGCKVYMQQDEIDRDYWDEAPNIFYCPLHSAAPELLDALEALMEPSYSRRTAEHKARAAIAKARGEKP